MIEDIAFAFVSVHIHFFRAPPYIGLPTTPEVPKMMVGHSEPKAAAAAVLLSSSTARVAPASASSKLWPGGGDGEDDKDDGLLKRKTFSILRDDGKASEGRNLLDIVSESSEDEESEQGGKQPEEMVESKVGLSVSSFSGHDIRMRPQ